MKTLFLAKGWQSYVTLVITTLSCSGGPSLFGALGESPLWRPPNLGQQVLTFLPSGSEQQQLVQTESRNEGIISVL